MPLERRVEVVPRISWLRPGCVPVDRASDVRKALQLVYACAPKDVVPAVTTLAAEPSAAHLKAAEESVACKEFLADFNFQVAVRYRDFGKTAQFIILDAILRLRVDITEVSAGYERKRSGSVHHVHDKNVWTAA